MIYIVYDETRYEGCSKPLAAFSDRHKAEDWAKELQAAEYKGSTTTCRVKELEITK